MSAIKLAFLFLVLTPLLLSFAAPFAFAQKTEVQYPDVPGGAEAPQTTRIFLPKYIQYLFYFAIGLAGFIAFGAIVWGGIKYLTSVGNPSQMADAQSQILYGFLGVVLLLGSYILLNSINPQLTQLQIAKCRLGGGAACPEVGIILCKAGSGCSDNPGGTEGVDFIRVKSSLSCLVNCEEGATGDGFEVGSIWYGNSSNELRVQLYRDKNYQNLTWDSAEEDFIEAGTSIPWNGSVNSVNSVKLTWKMPGVYLFSEGDCIGEARLYTSSNPSLGDWDNKPRSIYIIPKLLPTESGGLTGLLAANVTPGGSGSQVEEKLGAILHEKQNPPIDGGNAEVVLGNTAAGAAQTGEPWCTNLDEGCENNINTFCVRGQEIKNEASAITIFRQVTQPITVAGDARKNWGDGVTVFGNFEYNEQDPKDRKADEQIHCGPFNLTNWPDDKFRDGYPRPWWIDGTKDEEKNAGEDKLYPGTQNESERNCETLFSEFSGKISSIKVEGKFIAILYRKDGRGEVFRSSDPRLTDNHIGDNEARYLLVIPVQE